MYAKFAAASLLAASAAAATSSDVFSGSGAEMKTTGAVPKKMVSTKYTYRFDENGNNADTNYKGTYTLEEADKKFSAADGPYSMYSCVESNPTETEKYSCTMQSLLLTDASASVVTFSIY
jgi:hypothetical protein